MASRSVRAEHEAVTSPRGLRSPSSASDVMSSSGRSTVGGLPTASPRPAYFAQSAAETLAATELDRPTAISDAALELLNGFLDQTLYNILALSKSTSLTALRVAVPKLLKPRLGEAAMQAAEEDLRDFMDGEDTDGSSNTEQARRLTDFDLELVWKLARLRCMAYARLGDMEDEDAEEYLEQEGIEGYAHNADISTNSNSTLFLTSILEFLGEQSLCITAQHAERRHNLSLGKKVTEDNSVVEEDVDLVIETADIMQLGREGPLSRLWRSWRRDTRATEPLASRSNTPGHMMSPNLAEQYRSRANSLVSPADAISEEESSRSEASPSQIPLPIRDNDIDEIEVPGLAPELDNEQQARSISVPGKSQRRPVSMLVMPGHFPSHPTGPVAPTFKERSPLRPQWSRARSQSLPTPDQTPLTSPKSRHDQDEHPPVQHEIEEHAKGSVLHSAGEQAPVEQEVSADPQPSSQLEHSDIPRASVISGTVAAIAGALGVEAMRSSRKNKGQLDPHSNPEWSSTETKQANTIGEDIVGHSQKTSPPKDANTGPSINHSGDFDSINIPAVKSREDLAEGAKTDQEVSDPEDLALSSGDEENAAQTPRSGPRDSGFAVAKKVPEQISQGQHSTPSSPSSPKRVNREAAVYQNSMMPMHPESEVEPQPQNSHIRSDLSDKFATRFSTASEYSQPEGDSTALPIQRPASGEQESSAWPAVVPIRNSSLEQPKQTQAHSASKMSRYSHHSKSSSGSSKLLGFQRDSNGLPVSQQRATFKDGSSSPRIGHSRETSLTGDKGTGGGAVAAATAAGGVSAATLAARRQHVRLRSGSGENSKVDEEKKKSLEILINSDETLHYTLTPESARLREEQPRSLAKPMTQTQELADFLRDTAPLGEEQSRLGPAKSARQGMNALRANPPDRLQTPVEQRAAVLAAVQAASRSHNQFGAPRDARPERNTTRDLADYARSTGPAKEAQLPQALATRPDTGNTARSASGGVRPDGVPMAPVGKPSIDSARTTTTSTKSANRLKFQARDARPSRDAEAADLIDFIREGPPRKLGEHRIDRHVAPFRTTMDSDDFNALARPVDPNRRSSVGSAQESSIMTGRSVQESTNSRTGLLENHKSPMKANGIGSAGTGIAKQTIPELNGIPNGMPPKTRRKPKDPYAIDDSDDEALEEELTKPPPRQEESLIDFLRNTAPPPGMTTQPILAATTREQTKSGLKRSASSSKLKDVLLRQNSSANASARNGAARPGTLPRERSPHLTQTGSKLDKYRPTQPTHAAHIERNRPKPKAEPRAPTTVRTGTSDLADYLMNSGPPGSPPPATGEQKYVSSNVKEQAGFLKFFSRQRGSVRR